MNETRPEAKLPGETLSDPTPADETQPGQPQRNYVRPSYQDDRPGDPVCLLRRVCQRCGSVADFDPPTTCPTCHADMPAA